MNHSFRKSLWARLAAVGFIIIITSGNFWVVEKLTGQDGSVLLEFAGLAGLMLVITGATGLACIKIREVRGGHY